MINSIMEPIFKFNSKAEKKIPVLERTSRRIISFVANSPEYLRPWRNLGTEIQFPIAFAAPVAV